MASHTEEELEPRHEEIMPQHEEIMPQHEEPHKDLEPTDRANVGASQGVGPTERKVRKLAQGTRVGQVLIPCDVWWRWARWCTKEWKGERASGLLNNQVVMRDLARDRTLVLISPTSSGSPQSTRHRLVEVTCDIVYQISLVERRQTDKIEDNQMVKSGTQRELGFHHRAL